MSRRKRVPVIVVEDYTPPREMTMLERLVSAAQGLERLVRPDDQRADRDLAKLAHAAEGFLACYVGKESNEAHEARLRRTGPGQVEKN